MDRSSIGAEAAKTSASVAESISRTKDALGNAASAAMDSASGDFEALRRDLAGLKDTLAAFLSRAGSEAVKSARDVSSALSDSGMSFASGAAERGKSFAGELEAMTRRNPLGALAAAVVLGIVIGRLGRRS